MVIIFIGVSSWSLSFILESNLEAPFYLKKWRGNSENM